MTHDWLLSTRFCGVCIAERKHPIEKARQIRLAGFSYSSFDSAYVFCSSSEQLPAVDETGYWKISRVFIAL
jgi:hypothetical protein